MALVPDPDFAADITEDDLVELEDDAISAVRASDTLPEPAGPIDLDSIVGELSRAHTIPPLRHVPIIVSATPSRPSWGAALALSGAALIVGASIALAVVYGRARQRDGNAARAIATLQPAASVGVIGAGPTVQPEPAPPVRELASDLPARPSRWAVQRMTRRLSRSVRSCARGEGVAMIELELDSSGRTKSVRVEARGANDAQRACMRRRAEAARVPPFSDSSLVVRFPVDL